MRAVLYGSEAGGLGTNAEGKQGMDERGDPHVFTATERSYEPAWYEADKKGSSKPQLDDKFRASGVHYTSGEVVLKVNSLSAMHGEDGAVSVQVEAATADGGAGCADRQADKAKGSIMNVPKLKKMIQMNRLDPNDPRNQHLLDLLSANKEQSSEGFVRFDTMADMLRLVGDDKDDRIRIKDKERSVMGQRWIGEQHLTRPAGVRHKMLLSRSMNPALFSSVVGWNPVPLIEKEIDDDDMLNKVYSIEFPDADDISRPSVDNKKVQKVMAFRQKVQEQVRKAKAKHGARVKRVFRLEDVVSQPALPVFGGADIIAAIVHLLRKRSSLRPEVNAKQEAQANPSSCSISVTVQRAHNLPRRRAVEGAAAPGPLECIVEAKFDKQRAETPVSKGVDPAWNSRLRLKFEPAAGWSPSSLLKVSDSLHLTVFDTKVWQKASSDGGNVRKMEKRWLGSVSFPFTTLYTSSGQGRIDGVFALDAPPHILGYTAAEADDKKKGGKGKEAPGFPMRPSLQVCVSLDPPLKQPAGSDDAEADSVKLPGQPALDLLVRRWVEECSAPMHCRGRQFQALGRFLSPLLYSDFLSSNLNGVAAAGSCLLRSDFLSSALLCSTPLCSTLQVPASRLGARHALHHPAGSLSFLLLSSPLLSVAPHLTSPHLTNKPPRGLAVYI